MTGVQTCALPILPFPDRKKQTDDDYAAYILALHLGKPQTIIDFLYERAMSTPFSIYNNATGCMEARNANGTWAGPDNGWTGRYVS